MSQLLHQSFAGISIYMSTVITTQLVTSTRRLCFRLGLFVGLLVCEEDNSKTYGRTLMKFSGYVLNGTRNKWLDFGAIWITVWKNINCEKYIGGLSFHAGGLHSTSALVFIRVPHLQHKSLCYD